MIRDLEYENNTYAISTDGLTWTLADAPPYKVNDDDGGGFGFIDVVGGGPGETFGENLNLDLVHLTEAGTPVVIYYDRLALNRVLLGSESRAISFTNVASNPDNVVIAAGPDGLIARSTSPLAEYSWDEVGILPARIREARSDRQTIVAIWEDYDRLQQSRGSKGTVKYTRDGIVWEDVNLPAGASQEFLSLDYVHNKWFLTEFQEALYTSNDGVNRSAADLVPISVLVDGFEEEYHPLAHLYGNGTYIGRGKSLGFQVDPYYDRTLPVARSSDGINWVPLAEEVRDVSAIAFGGGQFIALEADRGFRSTNGITWEEFPVNGLPGPPESLAFFRGRWVASRLPSPWGPPPFQMFSPNGKDWFPATTSEGEEFPFPLDFNGLFEIFGVQFANLRMPAVSSSSHGLVWDFSEFISGQEFPFFVYESITVPLVDRLVAVGDDFRLVRSQPITPAPSPQGISFIDTSHIEARISPGLTELEWPLQYSAPLKPGEWIPEGDWKTVTEEEPFLFWKTSYQGDKGFFRLAFRVPF